ncbi:hypothetical protein [Ruegeria sp.]|uniref:hypothetical protein n=1 Tax=Ruegeria sp. TaxID=1879320 RepID=UPI00231C759B|nr:hypothetical protein [Ruegeria sp.]MDA7964780.1 hypothetical protein [Ruegeria sp.]
MSFADRIFQVIGGLFLVGLLLLGATVHFSVKARSEAKEAAREQILLKFRSEWREMCAIKDCDQFPVGYATYASGTELYYFPLIRTMVKKPPSFTGGVSLGRYVELDEENNTRRIFSEGGTLKVSACCHYLLAFYGLNEGVPMLLRDKAGKRMPSTITNFSPYNRPGHENKIDRWLDFEVEDAPSLQTVIRADQPSFNDDFWLLYSGEPNEKGGRDLKLLSKRPLINDRHVLASCDSVCTFATVSLKEATGGTQPHITLKWMTIPKVESCNPGGTRYGCPLSMDAFGEVPRLLAVIDEMFEAAKQKPSVQH